MKFMGSKRRIAAEILPIILKDRGDKVFVEPFAGGMNVTSLVNGKRIAADNNEFLIEMWKGIVSGEKFPTTIEKQLYDKARECARKNDFSELYKSFVGWVGWMGSFNGRFFDGGYSGHNVEIDGKIRDYIAEQIKNTLAQKESLIDVNFVYSDYNELQIPENSLIYCDPPYENTKQYSTSKNFDHSKFWEWCRNKAMEGHTVFVSEHKAPEDFICVWRKEITNAMSLENTYKPTEKLFTWKKY